jgi:hypothetical protein
MGGKLHASLPFLASFYLLHLPLPFRPTTLLHHNLIKLRVPSQKPEPALHRIYLHRVGFALDFSLSFNQQIVGLSPFIHCVLIFFRIGVLWFFGFRSTHLRSLLQDVLFNNGFSGIFGVRQWPFLPQPLPGCWCMLPTRWTAL